MEQGFVSDNNYGHGFVNHWVPGAPRKSFWFGLALPKAPQIPIGTFRCTACGFLECYARQEFAAAK
jgi:hypothetical protein